MKKLVKKIALPGAILAFAMALFGGATYAYENFKLWNKIPQESSIGVRFRRTVLTGYARQIKC